MLKRSATCVALQQRRPESARRTRQNVHEKPVSTLNLYDAFTKVGREALALLPLRTTDKEGRTMKSFARKMALAGAILAGCCVVAGQAQADALATPPLAG